MEIGEYSVPTRDVIRARMDRLLFRPTREEEEVVFTSPLTVKVYEEVKEKRKEEVDLETGRRRSYVEEVRYEVLDLTGDTPERGNQRTPLQPLPSQNSEAAKIRGKRPPTPTKSPLPDLSVLCLSSPTPTRGAALAARYLTPGRHCTAGKEPVLRNTRPRTAGTSKYPLLR